jgi:hypothetical protein
VTAVLLPNGKQQYFTTAGLPAVGYKIATFDAGTSNPRITWQDALKVAQNANPVILDARGEASIFWEGAYKVQLQDSTGAVIWTQDNLQSQLNGFTASLVPAVTNTVDLGSVGLSWRNLYLGTSGIPALGTVGLGFWLQTAAEAAVAIVPTNFFYPPYTMLRYGADPTGAANSTAAINNCFIAAAQAGYSKVTVGVPGATLRVDGTINWPVDKVGCDWQGAFLDCTHQTAGYSLNPTASFTDSTTRVGLVKAHPMENFWAMGPCTSANFAGLVNTGFLNVVDPSGPPYKGVAGITIRNGGCSNFYFDVNYGNGSFFTTFENWSFTVVQNPPAGANGYTNTMLNIPLSTTSGERNSFVNCFFGIAASSTVTVILNQANNNSDTYFENCSFDAIGSAGRLFTISNGAVFWQDCHLEASLDTDKWIAVTGQSTVLGWDHLTIIVDGAKTAFAIFDCDTSVVQGGISVGTTFFVDGSTYALPLVSGLGPVVQTGPIFIFAGGTFPQYVAASLNILADGGLTGATFAADGWTAGGPAPPTIVNTPLPPSGATNVFKFTVASAQTNTLSLVRTCKPGQIMTGQMYVRADVLTGSGATFTIGVSYLNTAGAALGTGFQTTYTLNQAYTLTPLNPGGGGYIRAPAGTAQVKIQMTITGNPVTGAPIAYVGSLQVDVQ